MLFALPGPTPTSIPVDLLRERVKTLGGFKEIEILWSSTFKIHCRNAEEFRAGKIALLGDAAHLNSPAGGQSMNSGIQDAHNLAWKVASIMNGGNKEELLNSYDVERQDAIRNGVDVFTDRLTTVTIVMHPFTKKVVILLFGWLLMLKSTRMAAPAAGMLNVKYRPGSLIAISGGMLNKDRTIPHQYGALVEEDGIFTVVRPDDFIAYQGTSSTDANRYYSKIRVKPLS